jgi:hypothetical protein
MALFVQPLIAQKPLRLLWLPACMTSIMASIALVTVMSVEFACEPPCPVGFAVDADPVEPKDAVVEVVAKGGWSLPTSERVASQGFAEEPVDGN